MSKDIIVLAPNGRRQKVTCSPDTTILKVLEDVCAKQGFQATEYNLKHHNHILDLTTTVRFSNLPNKATLEMVEAERKRLETNVTIGLLLEDGERRTAEFSPNTSLLDLLTSLAPQELQSLQHPSVMYMRQEVTGIPALKDKTLRQLGLLGGRAMLRLLNKTEEAKQANVSAVYRCPIPEKQQNRNDNEGPTEKVNLQPNEIKPEETPATQPKPEETATPGPSNAMKKEEKPFNFNPIKLIKQEKRAPITVKRNLEIHDEEITKQQDTNMEVDETAPMQNPSNTLVSQSNLERRLKIDEEVTFIGTHKAIAFMQPDHVEEELNDLPDDFYELSVEEVRKLYHDLQQHRKELEDSPLLLTSKKENFERQTSQLRMASYKNVVVRVQFPDRIVLQGVFAPTDTIQDVTNFIKNHLKEPNKPFHTFITPLKETLNPKMTLIEAKFVPCVHMHFKWLDDIKTETYLIEETYLKLTSSDAANILASKYRAPSRRKPNDPSPQTSQSRPTTSSGLSDKISKWLRG